MKKIIITSGGTREYIDDVRVLTNISSGKLGAVIAETFASNYMHNENVAADFLRSTKEEIKIYYVYTKGSITPVVETGAQIVELVPISDTRDLIEKMALLVPECDYIIHSMAVSDFSFKKSKGIKLKSDSKKDFIKHLKKNIKKNPKVISMIKVWNPDIVLVGFKFEVGLSVKKLHKIALASLVRNNADFVIANDKKEMQDNNEHIAYILHPEHGVQKCKGKLDIAQKLKTILNI